MVAETGELCVVVHFEPSIMASKNKGPRRGRTRSRKKPGSGLAERPKLVARRRRWPLVLGGGGLCAALLMAWGVFAGGLVTNADSVACGDANSVAGGDKAMDVAAVSMGGAVGGQRGGVGVQRVGVLGGQDDDIWVAPSPDGLSAFDAQLRDLIGKHLSQARSQPESPGVVGELAFVYEANDLWGEAKQCYERAAALDPRDALWLYHAAICGRLAGDVDGAVRLLRVVAERQPRAATVHYRLGELLFERGAFDEAEACFRRTIELVPMLSEGYVGLGRVMLRRRDFAQAEALAKKALSIDPGYGLARYTLGMAYRGLGRGKAARRELVLGVDTQKRYLTDPVSSRLPQYYASRAVQLRRGQELSASGRLDQAVAVFERALSRHPDDVDFLNNYAVVLLKQGALTSAMEVLDHAERVAPDSYLVHANRSKCLVSLGHYLAAVAAAERSVALRSTSGVTHLSLGQALAAMGRFDEAAVALKEASRLDSRNPVAHVLLAKISNRLGDPMAAKFHWMEASKRVPTDVTAHVGVGGACLELGEIDGAEEAIAFAIALAPDRADVRKVSMRLAAARGR